MARMLVQLNRVAEAEFSAAGVRWPGTFIISGYRSPSLQDRINPNAPGSLHTRCPALAVDLRIGDVPASISTREEWQFLGGIWKSLGGRWGGEFSEPDLNHFDHGQLIRIT